ncbi:MAG: ATP-binding cassette domain-containing protein [Syntrophomonadaceae bacterium]|jgi:ABC-2 type transport system ATP-binding protein|nr:ABC transporter ATP-binding protein [Bacillota bacterium]NLP24506.1 ABC transporter ATP-binding protein [Syntrophomonadaceae bacterium]
MIEFKQVKKYFGTVRALDNFQAELPSGRVIGLFGPNGAGKSTALKMIAGLNRPNRGQVLVDGLDPRKTRDRVAYLPEIDHLYPWMTVGKAANFIGTFYSDWDQEKYLGLLSYLCLDENMKIGKISKGQRAKVKLLLTLSRRSSYLLLDEPLSGIDLLTREEIINSVIRDYREGEQTIIISTHEIGEIEGLVDEVIFIQEGKIVLTGNAEDLREERNMSLVEIMKEAMRSGR